tara:strand:+ start:5489 stop:6418 length:930 start_codon:yes stop_codon:yes gene_type:complete
MVFNHPYLKDKIIDVKPVEAGQKWKGIVSNYREKENDPFLFKKVVKSFELPLNSASKGGGVAIIMDSVTKSVCPDVMNDAGKPEELTEQEYFEKIIGKSLNPYLPKDTNFWRMDSRARVQIRDARLRLDLKSPMDMLKFKILSANNSKFAASPQAYRTIRRASYEYVFTNVDEMRDETLERLELEAKAYSLFDSVCKSESDMRDFLRVAGKSPSDVSNIKQLKASVGKLMEDDREIFVEILDDPLYEDKLFIADGRRAGNIDLNRNIYTLDSGVEIGTLSDTIHWFNKEENQETRLRVQAMIDQLREIE